MTIRNVNLLIHEIKPYGAKKRFCHFDDSRMIYGILAHKYDIISGIFPKYLQKMIIIGGNFPKYLQVEYFQNIYKR